MLDLAKDTQNSVSFLVQCLAKSGKAVPGSGSQERTNKLATNIEYDGRGCEFPNFCD